MSAANSGLEQVFFALWSLEAGTDRPEPVRDYRFDETRRSLDFAWPDLGVAVEICGVDASATKYRRADELTRFFRKLNDAAHDGWLVLVFTSRDLKSRPHECVERVERLVFETSALHQTVQGRDASGEFWD